VIIVAYRQAKPEDLPFIYSTWLKNARKQGDSALMTNSVYYQNETNRIRGLVARSHVSIICNPDDADHIYAWACYSLVRDLFIIHYCYVKKSYRGLGIMSEFFKKVYPRFGKDQTAITSVNEAVAPLRESYKLLFNPYLQELVK
jgi:predicted GNAT family acetyltransferase